MSDQFQVNFGLAELPSYDWLVDGSFKDVDGNYVRAKDDVAILQATSARTSKGYTCRVPAGVIATVLFFQSEPDGYAQLECEWPQGDFSFGVMANRFLRLHLRAEQKYASDC